MLNNKPLRYSLTATFTFGATALVAILSFSGMFFLSSNIAISLGSCILAVLLEGEVYKQNILKGMGMLLHIGTYIRRNNYVKTLKKLSHDESKRNDSPLLADYYALLQYQSELQHAHKLNKNQKAELEKTENSIAEIEELFIRYLQGELDESYPDTENLIGSIFTSDHEKIQLQNELDNKIKREKTLLWLTMPVTFVGGALAVLVTASELSATFLTFGLTLTPVLLAAAVWPIAIVAAVGFMIMIYKTFVDIIHNQVLQKRWKSFKKLFSEEKSTVSKVMYVVGICFLTALALVATIATAGTWWSAAKSGLALLPFLKNMANTLKTVLISIGMSLLGIAMFAFDYVNNLESFQILTTKLSRDNVPLDERDALEQMSPIKKMFTIFRYNFQHAVNEWIKKPWGIMLNPFAWINLIIGTTFRAALFVGHCISIGVTSDRLGDLNAAIPATIASLQEVTTDLPYQPKTEKHGHHHLHDDHHDHHHPDLASYFLNVVLFPTKFMSALWNSAFGHKSFKQYFWKELGIHKNVVIAKPQISEQLQSYKDILSQTATSNKNDEKHGREIESAEEVYERFSQWNFESTERENEFALSTHRNSFYNETTEAVARSYQPEFSAKDLDNSIQCG